MTVAGPVWLTSRFAGGSAGHARIILAALIVLLLATLLALRAPDLSQGRTDATATQGGQTDVLLYDQIVSGVRAGGDYYAVTADALRQGDYPLRPFVTFRLPTLAVVEANLPARAVLAMLYALVAAVVAAWLIRLRRTFTTAPPVIVAMILLAAGLVAFVQPDLILFHEVWAGLLIALSLALRRPGRWIESVAFGLAAMLVRETAALYVAVMFIAAVVDGERREATGWFAATAVLFAAVVAHAHAAGLVTRATDLQSPGWSQMLGFGYYVRAMATSTALAGVPLWLAAPLVGLALFGWASWRDALAVRAVATFAVYALLLGLFGRADTFYWALMTAPALLIGLVFVPDGVRDLARAILGRRRITVTRVAR